VIAGLLHQIVQPGALSPQHQNAIRPEVKLGVIGRSAFVEPQHPDILLLHLLKRANEVRNPGNPHMLRSPGRCLGHGRGHRSRSPFRKDHTVDARAIGGSQQRSQVVGVLDAIESEKEPVLSCLAWSQQILNPQESPLPNDRQHALMGIRPGKPG